MGMPRMPTQNVYAVAGGETCGPAAGKVVAIKFDDVNKLAVMMRLTHVDDAAFVHYSRVFRKKYTDRTLLML